MQCEVTLLLSIGTTLGTVWSLVVLLLSFMLLAFVTYTDPARIPRLLKAAFNERMTNQLMREEQLLANRSSLLLLFLFAVSMALLLSLTGAYFMESWQPESIRPFFLLLAAFLLFPLVHWAIHLAFRHLIGDRYGISEYIYSIAIINEVSVLLLLPLAFILAFISAKMVLPILLVFGLVLIAIAAYRAYRGVRIAFAHKADFFYFIFYLCALEILPILLVVKVFAERSNVI